MPKTAYVVGFMFDCEDPDKVLLICKNRPDWQRGRLNGVGGHVEPGEKIYDAMVREFHEEVGIETDVNQWSHFATLSGDNGDLWEVNFFRAKGHIQSASQKTDESLVIVPIQGLDKITTLIPNLRWLIPMGQTFPEQRVTRYRIVESPV